MRTVAVSFSRENRDNHYCDQPRQLECITKLKWGEYVMDSRLESDFSFDAEIMKTRSKKRWSAEVTRGSNALDLQPKIFTQRSPRRIALSLKHSAESSRRRKATPFQSAMSMLNFYINRAGPDLPKTRKAILTKAKDELRKLFHKNGD